MWCHIDESLTKSKNYFYYKVRQVLHECDDHKVRQNTHCSCIRLCLTALAPIEACLEVRRVMIQRRYCLKFKFSP